MQQEKKRIRSLRKCKRIIKMQKCFKLQKMRIAVAKNVKTNKNTKI